MDYKPTNTATVGPLTEGECLFRDYLLAQGYAGKFEFEKPRPGKRRVVDYTLAVGGNEFLFDVKDFEPSDFPAGMCGAYDPYSRIRKKIEEGRKKFKEYKEFPCSVVLRNQGNFAVSAEDPLIVFGSMYGDAGITFSLNQGTGASSGPAKQTFLGRGKMIRPNGYRPQNTTISALITLRYVNIGQLKLTAYLDGHPEFKSSPEKIFEVAADLGLNLDRRDLGVIVWENAFATMPLSRDLFQGPFDERWGIEPDGQRLVFRGKGLPELACEKK